MTGTATLRPAQVRQPRSARGTRASWLAAITAIFFVLALPAGVTFAAPIPEPAIPGPELIDPPAPVVPELPPPDFEVCTEDCGPDDPPVDGPDDFEVCTEDCGGGDEDGGENGNEDGGGDEGTDENGGGDDGTDEEIPLPTRIDTGNSSAGGDGMADAFWMIAAIVAVALSAVGYRVIRDQR